MSKRRPTHAGRADGTQRWGPFLPYFMVMACLFALSLAAPHTWDHPTDSLPDLAETKVSLASAYPLRPVQSTTNAPAHLDNPGRTAKLTGEQASPRDSTPIATIDMDEFQRRLELVIHGPEFQDLVDSTVEEISTVWAAVAAPPKLPAPSTSQIERTEPRTASAEPGDSPRAALASDTEFSPSAAVPVAAKSTPQVDSPGSEDSRPHDTIPLASDLNFSNPDTAPIELSSPTPQEQIASAQIDSVQIASPQIAQTQLKPLGEDRLAMQTQSQTQTQTQDDGPSLSPAISPGLLDFDQEAAAGDVRFGDLLSNENPGEDNRYTETSPWPPAPALVASLEELYTYGLTFDWAVETVGLVSQWTQLSGSSTERAEQLLAQLRQAAVQGDEISKTLNDVALREKVQQARYALIRRLDLWQAVLEIQQEQYDVSLPAGPTRQSLAISVEELLRITQQGSAGRAWQDYLLLSPLREIAWRDGPVTEAELETIQEVLTRLGGARLSRAQREFLSQAQFQSLRSALQSLAAGPVDVYQLLRNLEAYESAPQAESAMQIAKVFRSLAWSPSASSRDLAERIEQHYRNANLRVAVSSELANRFLPPPQTEVGEVNDVIVGASVRGQSRTTTSLQVRTLPDESEARVGLEANGTVLSETVSVSGPASFRSSGDTTFEARKLIKLSPQGIRVVPSTARASATNNLLGLETDYDRFPLLQAMVRNAAISQHADAQGQARAEVEQKVARQVEERLDNEANSHILEAHRRLEDRVLRPLRGLSLQAAPLDMISTDRRVIARFRLAGDDQLGAHVPRPLAPSDSLLSIQLNETSVNNALQQLELDGASFKLPDLFRSVVTKFGRPDVLPPEDLDTKAVVQFAPEGAVSVRFLDDLVQVELSIASVKIGRTTYENFKVRSFYKPAPIGLQPTFVREGLVELESAEHLALRHQIVLRSVFARLFPADDPVSLIGDRLDEDPRMDGLKITQLVVSPGWIGLAIGPVDSQWIDDLVHTARK